MRECLTVYLLLPPPSAPTTSLRMKPVLVEAFPIEKMRWISALPSIAQERSGWHTGTLLSPQVPSANPASFCLIFKSRGRTCIPGRAAVSSPCLQWRCSSVCWNLGMSSIPWQGCPWLLQSHPGGHWPVLDEMQLPVCWEEKGPQSLANHLPCRSQNSCLLITFPDW